MYPALRRQRYYIGHTTQPFEARPCKDNQGIYDGYTKPRRPVVLAFTDTYERLLVAIARERLF